MNKVKFYEGNNETIVIKNFESMINNHKYIGFVPSNCSYRYFIIVGGPYRGLAVNAENTWSDHQSSADGDYFIFDSANELYEWMK